SKEPAQDLRGLESVLGFHFRPDGSAGVVAFLIRDVSRQSEKERAIEDCGAVLRRPHQVQVQHGVRVLRGEQLHGAFSFPQPAQILRG
ncbi:MAG: hypothetical protein M0R80_30310, partial [Proteobacteria bacterium]|nr:hypothetical protein [Pseudomonadota bacterium]